MMRIIQISIATAMPLAGCVTPDRRMATTTERAACVDMDKQMGLGTTHDHAEMRGMGHNPMNLSHDRCVQILA